MQSNEPQELLEAFSEQRPIGPDIATAINNWVANNMELDMPEDSFSADSSGDSVIMVLTDNGCSDKDLYKMLRSIGYTDSEDSDETDMGEEPSGNNVDERMSECLLHIIEVTNSYPCFVKNIELSPQCTATHKEVKLIFPTEMDFRRMNSRDAHKIMFMHCLKDIREVAARYSMTDEAMCFCASRKEFWLILRTPPKPIKD